MSKKSMKWKDIVSNAEKIKKSVENNQKLAGIEGYSFPYLLAIFCTAVKKPGKDVTLTKNYSNCAGCKGTNIYKNLTKKEYLDVAGRTLTWMDKNSKVPNYSSLGKELIRPKLLLFCLAKIIVFYNKNKAMPNTCWFAMAVFNTTKSAVKGTLCKKLSSLSGIQITNYRTLYQAMAKIFTYDYYYDDKQTQSQTISRKKGNCVDLNQIEYKALLEMYSTGIIQIVRGTVRCSDGKVYGHVWCRIYVSGKWLNIDASAAAKGKALGTVICPSVVSITNVNPAWAVNDTGDM